MKRIVSGITATGNLTLGNYIGSIKNIVKSQDDYEIFMFVADFHGITNPINPNLLKSNVENQLALYLACGIDVNKTKLFKQSEIIGHTELFYFLSTITNEGQLKRMTQYKDKKLKLKNNTEQVPLGIMLYPILMAADILLYDADGVIVGKDQKQHIELTRDLANKINSRFNLNLKIPEPIIPDVGSKIMALKTPTKKMSKSDKNFDETIFLLDDIEEAKKKIISSLTDSENKIYFDEKRKPGISNLLTIYSSIKNISIKESEKYFKNYDYREFKIEVSNVVADLLLKIQINYKKYNKKEIRKALDLNLKFIQNEAKKNLEKISNSFGIV